VFDHIELGIITEWTPHLNDKLLVEMQEQNLVMTNEKDRYLAIFENIPGPVIILDESEAGITVNQVYAQLFLNEKVRDEHYHISADLAPLPQWLMVQVNEMIAKEDRHCNFKVDLQTANGRQKFNVQITTMLDISQKIRGMMILFGNIAERGGYRWPTRRSAF